MTRLEDITYTLTGDVDNFRIIRGALSERVRIDPNGATRAVTGFLATDPTTTRLLIVENIASTGAALDFEEENLSSDPQNRFAFGASLGHGECMWLLYEPAIQRWLSVGGGGSGGVEDHGDLTGLADDDHLQYAALAGRAGGQILNGGTAASEDLTLTSTAHATKGDIFIGPLTWPTADGATDSVMVTDGSGQLSLVDVTSLFDHGDLDGLSDDDHSQYARLGGRVGGQALYGGTDAGEDLRLTSTLHATKGDIFLGLFTWPVADGSTGYVLQTNGSGVLSFVDPGTFVVGDHGALTGLSDDDHTQYALLAGRAGGQVLYGGTAANDDLRLTSTVHSTKGDIFLGLFTWPTADATSGHVLATNGSGVLSFIDPGTFVVGDHGTLTGLADDDHAQYAALAGRSGGQILYGGTAANDDLRLTSTSNVTKGDIFIGPLTWPTADGSSGYVLSTNGSGQLSFIDPGTFVVGDHGTLTGLGDDDHTQYAILAGRAGSQTLNGGTAAGEDLRLFSTAHATKGDIQIGLLLWPTADASANSVMITNGSGQLSLVSVTSLFDHGTLGGLADDDHTQYMLAESSVVDNTLVRWDGTTGRAVQESSVVLSDTEAMSGLLSAAASSFFSAGGTVATAGNFRGDSTLTIQARNVGNSADVPLVSWASDDVTFGHTSVDSVLNGTTVTIKGLRWPAADGAANAVMTTNGSGILSLVSVTSLFDHGTLGGLADDDHAQYMLAESSVVDNTLVRWDGTGGRSVQESSVVLSDAEAMSGLTSVDASTFYSVGTTPATAGHIRGNSTFTLQARNAGNSANIPLVSWATDDVTFGNTGVDSLLNGTTVTIKGLRWPAADGAANAVMITNGAGVLSLVAATTLFDHGTLGGLADDDHLQYVLAEGSSVDNTLVRWDATTGRAIQESGVTLTDGEAMSGLVSVDASSFFSVGGTVATAGNVRGDNAFTLQARDVANTANAPLVSWATDVATFGNSSFDAHFTGSVVRIRGLFWPSTDGAPNQVLKTDGSAVLSFATITSLFDHDDLTGLGDDDHTQYVLAEPSSVDNTLVRWDGTTGRAIQESGVTLSDAEAMSGLASVAASGFFSVGGTVATVGDIRTDSSFTMQGRNAGNTANIPLVSWASDNVTFGTSTVDLLLNGTTVTIKSLGWPTADGVANAVMTTDGAGQLSLVAISTLVDHGTLGGLADDDHSQYVLAEAAASVTDNRLVRWDGSGGRSIQTSAVSLNDAGVLDMNGGEIDDVAIVTITANAPILNIVDLDATANGKYWRFTCSSDNLALSMRDDSGALIAQALEFNRTGAVLDNVDIAATSYVTTNRTDASGVASDTFSTQEDNYAVTSTTTHLRIALTSGDQYLTGLASGTQGRLVRITNRDTEFNLILSYEDAASTSTNRFFTPDGVNYILPAGASVDVFYDGATTRWRILNGCGITRMQWRGVLQTTTGTAVEFFSIPIPAAYTYFVNVWVSSFADELETGFAAVHKEFLYMRDGTGDAALYDTHEINAYQYSALVDLAATNSTSSISLLVDPASAFDWRHNWIVEIIAAPLDPFV